MANFVIRPAGDPDWANARFLSGSLPITAVDAAGLGIDMGVDYEIGGLGDLATFQVTDVPAAMAAPVLTPGLDQIEVALAADPADGGHPITARTLRYRSGAAAWTIVQDISSPHPLTGLTGDTTYEVQACAVNLNGPGPWSPSISATTQSALGDTTAPVIGSITYTGDVLTVALTEDSGAATAVWATTDTGVDPIFTPGSGWSDTPYETGDFAVTAGNDSDMISVTTATPDGTRELSIYFYDAELNLSTVERVTITVANAAPSIAIAQQVGGVVDNQVNTFPYESNAITPGAGSDRLLVAAFTLNAVTNGVDLSDMQADFGAAARTFGTGTPMAIIAPSNENGRKAQVAFALLAAPSGTGTVMFSSASGTITAGQMRLYEITGASQSLGDHMAFAADGANGVTALQTSDTAVAGFLLSALAIERSDYTAEIAVAGGATLDAVALGGSGTAAVCAGFASEAVAAGTRTTDFTWTTAQAAELVTLNVAGA